MSWLIHLGPLPDPTPAITPGTTTPIQDALHWAHLDFVITLGALVASAAQIIGVFRTLFVATRAAREQARILARLEELLARAGQTPGSELPPGGPEGHDDPPV